MILILAGNYDEARYLARQENLQPRGWHYISEWRQIMGIKRGTELWTYGNWVYREDMVKIMELARAKELTVVNKW